MLFPVCFFSKSSTYFFNPALGISAPGRQGRGNHFVRHEQNIGTESPTPALGGRNAQNEMHFNVKLFSVFLF